MNCHKILPTRNLSHKTSVFACFCSLECLLKDFRIFRRVDATGFPCTGAALIKGGFEKIDTTFGATLDSDSPFNSATKFPLLEEEGAEIC